MSTYRTYRLTIASALACLCLAATGAFARDPVNVQDYIDASTNKNDHTEAIRAAFAEAGKTRVHAVVFPAGQYTISDTIDISGGNVTTPGASITQTHPEKDIFYSRTNWRRTIRHFTFRGGRDQIALGNKHTDQGFFLISECQFFEANGAAVRLYREGELDAGSSFVLVDKCTFSDCDQVLIVASDQAHLRDCWISTKVKKNNKAVIENYNSLTCQNILGVPRVSYNDQRWIDNYGYLVCRNFRFGGEGSGFTPVVNFAKGASIKLEDGCVFALGNNRRACAVYLEQIPAEIIMKNCYRNVPAVKISPKIDVQADLNSRQGRLTFDVGDEGDTCSGTLPKELSDAMARRNVQAIDYGTNQLSAAETMEAVAAAVAAAKSIPSAKEPGVMTYNGMKDGHRQVTDPAKYVEIGSTQWDLNDTLDGGTELASAYLALAPAGDDVVLMSRMDVGSYPHARIRDIAVDLDKTPYLTWRLKDNGVKGGHVAMKVINNSTEEMTKLVEDYYSDQFGYFAFDLRQALGVAHGKVNLDLKFYMCGIRISMDAKGVVGTEIKKGEYFLIDFLRLEAE